MYPKFFQIGFNKCGTTFIAGLFKMNDIPVVNWLEGELAEDIAYSKLTGRKPLQKWADTVTAFTDMESVRYLNMPIVEAFKEYEYLDQQFPGSVFLLNTRNVDDWIISRYMHRGGSYARACAQLHGVAVGDLADLWKDDWDRHLQKCRAYFGARPEFIEINIDEAQPADYRDALAPWFDLKRLPAPKEASLRKKRETYLPKLADMLTQPDVGHIVSDTDRQQVSAALARRCTPAAVRLGEIRSQSGRSRPVHFDAAKHEVRSRDSGLLPIRRGDDGRFYADPGFPALRGTVAAVNSIADNADRGEYWLDMQSNFLAQNEKDKAHWPILATCRKSGDANVFLWPMPWLHRLGANGLPGVTLRKEIPFGRKLDRAVWTGDLSGFALDPDGPDLGRPLERAIAAILSTSRDHPGFDHGLASLANNSRLQFIRRHADSDAVDIRFAPNARAQDALRKAGMSSLIPVEQPGGSPFDYRYIISLGGSPKDDDFLFMANSHSVVLKEEDGLELYHSGAFQPWEHYIPLAWGTEDLGEKLTWARTHPDDCARMSQAARDRCMLLADPAGRRQQLSLILSAYRLATGQGM